MQPADYDIGLRVGRDAAAVVQERPRCRRWRRVFVFDPEPIQIDGSAGANIEFEPVATAVGVRRMGVDLRDNEITRSGWDERPKNPGIQTRRPADIACSWGT